MKGHRPFLIYSYSIMKLSSLLRKAAPFLIAVLIAVVVSMSYTEGMKGLKHDADKASKDTKHTADKASSGTKHTADKASSGTKHTADKASSGTKHTADKASSGTKHAADQASKAAKPATKATVHVADHVAEDAKSMPAEISKETKDKPLQSIRHYAHGAWEMNEFAESYSKEADGLWKETDDGKELEPHGALEPDHTFASGGLEDGESYG